MFYSRIHGHFNFEFLYDEVVNKFDSGSTFVEIGAYLGKSTCYMAEKIILSGKDIKFNVIDNWSGHPSDIALAEEIKKFGDIYSIFLQNMRMARVAHKLNVIRADSSESADLFLGSSLDFVFIDAAHDYNSVKRDITAWLPKMKSRSILAGHDYGNIETEVKLAVDELLGDKIKLKENVWIYRIGDC
jgi:hypothetical protein